MNAIFFIFTALSLVICIIFAPDKALPAMLSGANKSLLLIFELASVYCVWMGVYKILEGAKITDLFAKLFEKPVNALFKNKNKKAGKLISLNIVCNMLGLGGIATPLGIKACKQLENTNNLRGAKLLVLISASSVQILPTTVISLATAYGAQNSEKLILPTLVCTIFSTTCAIFLFICGEKIKMLAQKGRKK